MTTRILLIAIVIILALSGYSYYLFRTVNDLRERNGELVVMANDSARQATTYRNRYNELVSKNESPTISSKDAMKLDEIRKTAKPFDGVRENGKNLTQTTKIAAKIDTSFKIPPILPVKINKETQEDTFENGTQILIDDGFNYLAIEPTGTIDLKISVPITGVVYWERGHKFWFLRWGAKKYYSEFKSDNPLVKLTNSEVIQIRKK